VRVGEWAAFERRSAGSAAQRSAARDAAAACVSKQIDPSSDAFATMII
jgi:hypothetical protein